MVEIANEYGALNIKELQDFEKENSIELPDDYRGFLIKFNGGTPLKPYLKEMDTIISNFYGIVEEPDWFSLFDAIADYDGRIPEYYIPIADDSFGNILIMCLAEKNYGQIAFWDHEKETEKKDGGYYYYDNVTVIASSFTDLINKLEKEPE